MKLPETHEIAIQSNIGDVQKISIHQGGIKNITEILTTSVYSDIWYAVFRELLTNSFDAVVKVGGDMSYITFRHPTEMSKTFVIEDRGVGMSYEQFVTNGVQIGNSSKTQDDTQTGYMGIGLKVVFSVAKMFTITCAQGGVENTFVMQYNSEGEPCFAHLGSREASSEFPNGFRIEVPIKDEDRQKMSRGLLKTLRGFDELPVLENIPEGLMDSFIERQRPIATSGRTSMVAHQSEIVMGNICYPAHFGSVVRSGWVLNYGIRFKARNGEVLPSASRESLRDHPHTNNSMTSMIDEALKDIRDMIVERVNPKDGYWFAAIKTKELLKDWSKSAHELEAMLDIMIEKMIISESDAQFLKTCLALKHEVAHSAKLLGHVKIKAYSKKKGKGLAAPTTTTFKYDGNGNPSVVYQVGSDHQFIVLNDCAGATSRVKALVSSIELEERYAILLDKSASEEDAIELSKLMRDMPIIKASTISGEVKVKEPKKRTVKVLVGARTDVSDLQKISYMEVEMLVEEAYQKATAYTYLHTHRGNESYNGDFGDEQNYNGISTISTTVSAALKCRDYGRPFDVFAAIPTIIVLKNGQREVHEKRREGRTIPSIRQYIREILSREEVYKNMGIAYMEQLIVSEKPNGQAGIVSDIMQNLHHPAHKLLQEVVPKTLRALENLEAKPELHKLLQEANRFNSVIFVKNEGMERVWKSIEEELPWLSEYSSEFGYIDHAVWEGKSLRGKLFLKMISFGKDGMAKFKNSIQISG